MPLRAGRRWRRLIFWLGLAIAAVGYVAANVALVPTFLRSVVVDSISMENTIKPGERLLYVATSGLRRGDIVLERVPAPPGSPDLIVRRVIGLPGDHVSCCNASGKIVVDRKALDEPYVYPYNSPSTSAFSVTLRSEQYWLLGDYRAIAYDSRGRGPVSLAEIPWRVVAVMNGLSITSVYTPQAFVAAGLAPADTRPTFPYGELAISGICGLALLGYAVFGVIRLISRRRRRKKGSGSALSTSSGP